MFPGASDVVRVGTERWAHGGHADALNRIFQEIGAWLAAHSELPFEELLREYERGGDPRVRVGDEFAYALYGPSGPFFLDEDELKSGMRGLVYKPVARRRNKTFVVDC